MDNTSEGAPKPPQAHHLWVRILLTTGALGTLLGCAMPSFVAVQQNGTEQNTHITQANPTQTAIEAVYPDWKQFASKETILTTKRGHTLDIYNMAGEPIIPDSLQAAFQWIEDFSFRTNLSDRTFKYDDDKAGIHTDLTVGPTRTGKNIILLLPSNAAFPEGAKSDTAFTQFVTDQFYKKTGISSVTLVRSGGGNAPGMGELFDNPSQRTLAVLLTEAYQIMTSVHAKGSKVDPMILQEAVAHGMGVGSAAKTYGIPQDRFAQWAGNPIGVYDSKGQSAIIRPFLPPQHLQEAIPTRTIMAGNMGVK